MRNNNDPRRNLRLVMLESAATASVISVPIMTPFFLSIGLNQEQIAMSQMAFTAVLMTLNIPLGWLADRVSRKWANVAGDLIVAASLLLYTTANSFWAVVFCESLFGVGVALSQGVDTALLKHFSEKIDKDEAFFEDKCAAMASQKQLATLAMMLLGGPLGAISSRLAIALSASTYLLAALFSALIVDDSEKLAAPESTAIVPYGTKGHTSAIRLVLEEFDGICGLIQRTRQNRELSLYIYAFAVAREVTHGIIWVFTPLMLQVGVPLAIVSIGWATNYVASYIGTKLARRLAPNMQDWQVFIVPIIFVATSGLVMFVRLDLITIWLYLAFGLAQGWSAATMLARVEKRVEPAERSSVESIARVYSQLLYIGAVWTINRAADIEPRYALLMTIVYFTPLAVPIAIKLRRVKNEP